MAASGSSVTIEFTLHVYEEEHLVRTGLLKYYDPLLVSDLYDHILSDLNTRSDTLPSTDPTGDSFPNYINAKNLSITIE